MKRITLSEEQAKQIYQDYLQGLSLDKLGEKYQISRHVLSRELKRYNFDITRRKYQVNEFFFDEINSEEKAYQVFSRQMVVMKVLTILLQSTSTNAIQNIQTSFVKH